MNVMIRPAPVRRSVTVSVSPERAFRLFTEEFSSWWPKSHSIASSGQKSVTVEPRVGGRWFETGEDGSECDWGEVLAWDPPHRLLLAWRLSLDWAFDPDLHTEVEVRFTALPEGGTRVDLEHGKLEGFAERAEEARTMFEGEGAWGGILQGFGERVAAA